MAINYSALGRGSSVNHPIMFLSTDRLSVLLLSQCPMTPAKNITIVPNFGAGMLSTLHASFSSVLSAVLYATHVDHSHHHIMPLYTYPRQHLWKIHIHSTSTPIPSTVSHIKLYINQSINQSIIIRVHRTDRY